MQTLAAGCGLIGLPRPVQRHGCTAGVRRPRLLLVAASGKGKAAPPPPPPEAVPPPLDAAPQDIPSYFQPAPPPQLQQGQVYQAVPQYGPPAVAPPQASFWGGIPPLVYVGIGVVLATVLGKVMAVVKGGPQKMQEMAMEQMMKQMMKQMGGAPGGANPFGAPGANPFGAPGANPFGAGSPFGAPGASPFGAAGSGFPSMSPAFDTTATPAPAAPAAAAASAPAAASSSTEEKAGEAAASSSTGSGDSKPKKRSAFVDVNAASSSKADAPPGSSGAEAGAAAGAAPPPPFGGMPPPGFGVPPPGFSMPPPPGAEAGAAAGSSQGAGAVAGTMLDMLKNPEMQKMLYPYLPEPMRNPDTFEWMLSNPEYRSQLEGMLQQQAAASGSPAVQEMMQGMDMSPEKMNAQFDQLGITPDQFLQKVMGDPDLAGMMTNPKVMAAIAECTKNPMAIFQYQNDEQVMRVFEKMSQLFPQAAGGVPGMPAMPPGFGAPPQGFAPPPTPPTQ
ncbi:hypothetical protein CHLNCDRAFT_59183 [Chlorella variabilis]|uniref:STI1 domain-containing protein n=1 Tax=Chlorella variabilis TaxID=554065 RepID=E1ZRF4_CHLVA|nr:hypothetical protein CHLNCDRAFT_59183 [Chlorella variabilis]EFN51559.1 hypothetical protein CHLNCDRAFT_59183 [Chlorella variabilis]|eukprot:XP_005843661.1 hypothetical protein CHLNCDRAFT_59183 [Chlorella variabilis]